MVLPTQAAFGLAATNLMQSTLDSIEERRKQDEEKATGTKKDPVAEARMSASTEAKRSEGKIAEALFSINNVDPNELKMQLTERLAAKLGIDLEEERSNYSLGKAIEEAVKNLDRTQILELEKDLGLKDAGVTLDTVIAAIMNPYGDDNARLMEGLTKVANGGKAGFDVARVIQRLEDVADPKTLEELKLGPQGYDPTRVEDAETRAERRDDIQALEASEKLEDVQEMQDAVKESNDKAVEGATPGEPSVAETAETDVILLLGATVEQARDTEAVTSDTPEAVELDEAPASGDVAPVEGEATTEMNAEAMEEMAAEALTEAQTPILAISVDDIGLYELLKQKLAA
ncbi:MAG: hypothetical protein SV862_02895 [Pseudomonadota bacterium]|nr:hypothetical protein [Pseudomonadota bacterium]|tara:strand:+ start:9221 stop:10255 length:1035 start_codon:yes stop_codon:yes gene_type:complete